MSKTEYMRQWRIQHPLYAIHQTMKARCYNPNNHKYHSYGGRGIQVCAQWLGANGFNQFCTDMGPRPKGKTLDRTDNDGAYCPKNCKWATPHEQGSNKRNNHETVGVVYRKGRWYVSLTVRKVRMRFGSYISLSYAQVARQNAEAAYLSVS